MAAHARLSPSGAHRWMPCPGSVVLEAGFPDTSSTYADEGTAAHFLATVCLNAGHDAAAEIGRTICLVESLEGHSEEFKDALGDLPATSFIRSEFQIDSVMAGHVQTYVDAVRQYAAGGQLMVEQRVEFSDAIGVPGQFGTSDAVILTADGEEIQVHDLKYGQGEKVEAFKLDARGFQTFNPQLALYALGALAEFGLVGDFKRVRVVIHQPRLNHVSEFDGTVEDLQEFAEAARVAAHRVSAAQEYQGKWNELHDNYLAPGEEQCRFCKAKSKCPKLTAHVLETVAGDFIDVSQPIAEQIAARCSVPLVHDNEHLGRLRASVSLIEGWCKAVCEQTDQELQAGRPVPGWKLVEGRAGNRKWSNEQEAEATLKAMRIKHGQMYDYKLISPTTAEKLAKAEEIGPRQWPKLQALITRADGKPTVAPATDPRPAISVQPIVDVFDDVGENVDDLV